MADSQDISERGDVHNSDVDSDREVQDEGNDAPRGRKRKPRPETWKQSVRKKNRNEGKAYYSDVAKKQIEERKIGPHVVMVASIKWQCQW